MNAHSNQTWRVFQSPILQGFQNDVPGRSFESSELFFQALFELTQRPGEVSLDLPFLVDTFESFRYFTGPQHYRALHAFLMECRANYIGEDFILSLENFPLPSRLQRLLFLYHEYLLFKKQHPQYCDPWDLVTRAVEQPPFKKLVWVDFHQHTFFSQQLVSEFSKVAAVDPIFLGPRNPKEHFLTLEKFVSLLNRARPSPSDIPWIVAPTAHSIASNVCFALEGRSVISPHAFAHFDDIYGYLKYSDPSPNRFVVDHVLPDALSDDPLWKSRNISPRPQESQAYLWTQYLALQELIPKIPPDWNARLIQPRSTSFPNTEELHILQDSQFNCHISPWCFAHQLQGQTIVWIYT